MYFPIPQGFNMRANMFRRCVPNELYITKAESREFRAFLQILFGWDFESLSFPASDFHWLENAGDDGGDEQYPVASSTNRSSPPEVCRSCVRREFGESAMSFRKTDICTRNKSPSHFCVCVLCILSISYSGVLFISFSLRVHTFLPQARGRPVFSRANSSIRTSTLVSITVTLSFITSTTTTCASGRVRTIQ